MSSDDSMNPNDPRAPVSDDTLNAWLDGQLTPTERAALEARLAQDAALRERLQGWRAQRQALQGLHREVLAAPLPASLDAAADRLAERHAQRFEVWRWGGMAASVLLAFGTGWIAHDRLQDATGSRGSLQASAPATVEGAQRFGQAALVAHAVYAPEVRHPVEVAASQQEHLVQWLSKRLGRPIKVPDLSAEGFELVGGRLLPGTPDEPGARAQFMFQTATGERVTLYLGALPPQGSDGATAGFRWTREGALTSFYWVDADFGYALAGPLPQDRMMALAQAVYRQR